MLLLLFASAFAMNLNDRLAQIAQLASEVNNLSAEAGLGAISTGLEATRPFTNLTVLDNPADIYVAHHSPNNNSVSSYAEPSVSTHALTNPESQSKLEYLAVSDPSASTLNNETNLGDAAQPRQAPSNTLKNGRNPIDPIDQDKFNEEISTKKEELFTSEDDPKVTDDEIPPIDFSTIEQLLQQLAPSTPPSELDQAMQRLEEDITLIQETIQRNVTVAQSSGLDQFVADQAVKLQLNAAEVKNIIRKVFERLAEVQSGGNDGRRQHQAER